MRFKITVNIYYLPSSQQVRYDCDLCRSVISGEEKSDMYNGRALIDEDMMRERGMTDFRRFRCDADVEPPRMMPRSFPSLRVAEEDDEGRTQSKL